MPKPFVEAAEFYIDRGCFVFPIAPGTKDKPLVKWRDESTNDRNRIREWGKRWPNANVGVDCSRHASGKHLVMFDVDVKDGRAGEESLLRLELEGKEFPETFTVTTTTGGPHYGYLSDLPLKTGTSVFAKDIDVRGFGGYVVGAGSTINGKEYVVTRATDFKPCPTWAAEATGIATPGVKRLSVVNEDFAARRGISILQSLPEAGAGQRNDLAFKAAARLKDEGISETLCLYLMTDHFKCEPALESDELAAAVVNAYRYGQNPPGVSAPEIAFSDATPLSQTPSTEPPTPTEILNKEYAWVLVGGGSHILWETTDDKGKPRLEHLSLQAFHQKLASKKVVDGDKSVPVSHLWMKSPLRRSYDGLCFRPGLVVPGRFYNLWRGFAVEPLGPTDTPSALQKEAVGMFLEHAHDNVCRGDSDLSRWLIAYFAHLVQRPWERPLTALVFRGRKGTGKSSLVERVGALIGGHFLSTAKKRFVTGNFNSHLENNLVLVLEEALWSGDKEAEGILKDLITGGQHVIEQKGKESYTVDNCSRIVIIGNEKWIVPASADERRFAVFDVGDGKRQDNAYFKKMRELMEAGGYEYLLRYLLDFDLTGIDVSVAPKTQGLLDQKIETLSPFHDWWFTCLREERISLSDEEGWPIEISRDKFRDAFSRYHRQRNISGRLPTEPTIGRVLSELVPKIDAVQRRAGEKRERVYSLPDIHECRKSFETYLGHRIDW